MPPTDTAAGHAKRREKPIKPSGGKGLPPQISPEASRFGQPAFRCVGKHYLLALGAFILLAFCTSAGAGAASDEALIRARLEAWATAFNARDAGGVCALFAQDLQSDTQAARNIGKAATCMRLRDALAAPDRKLTYAAEVHDVLVSGDLAVVRLTWTLTVEHGGPSVQSREIGLDVFRRDADGEWRIVRFMAFSAD